MKGGNIHFNEPKEPIGHEPVIQGFETSDFAKFDMKGGKGKSKSSKFSEFDFEKEWKEFEKSYNQKYGGASKKKKPTKKTSSAKKPAKKTSTKKPSSSKKSKGKTQRGGDEVGATFPPAQFFDEKATMSAPSSGPFQSAYGTIKADDGFDRNLAPYPESSGQQTGGAKKKSSKTKKAKTSTKTTKPKKDSKKKDAKKDTKKKDSKKDSKKKDTKSTGKKVSVLDKIKKFFAM
jgi:hypothetical protein